MNNETYYREHAARIYTDYMQLAEEIRESFTLMYTDDRRPDWMTREWIVKCLSSIYELGTDIIEKIIENL